MYCVWVASSFTLHSSYAVVLSQLFVSSVKYTVLTSLVSLVSSIEKTGTIPFPSQSQW